MSRLRLLVAGLAIAVIALLAPRVASAAAEPAGVRARRLEVVIAGAKPAMEALIAVLGPLLVGDERLDCRRDDATPAGAAGGPRLTGSSGIWIEAAPNGVVRIAAIVAHEPPAVRVVESGAPPPVIAEVVAQIVHQTAAVLLARDDGPDDGGDARAASQPQTRQARDAEAPVLARPDARRLVPLPSWLGYAVGLGFVSRTIFSTNAFIEMTGKADLDRTERGFETSLAVFTRSAPFGLSGALLVERATISSVLSTGWSPLDLNRWSARAMFGGAFRPHPSLEFTLAIGGGVERVAAEGRVISDATIWHPVARGAYRVAVLFPASGWEIAGAVTADVHPQTTFTQAGPDGGDTTHHILRLQPGFSIGFGWRG